MKYNRKGTELLRPEQAQTQKFGIKDPAMLIEILRDKLYSNKIRVICQEYLSNGRDAHREIGNSAPLEVILPSSTKPQIEFRDFGPGITPERMSDVFCFFGESTKRTSNKQTGGFGIGAKSAWSYSKQFAVTSYVDGTARHYAMAIDETRTGEMVLLEERPTDEPNGARIIVPVKQQDFRTFEEWVYRTTQWWDTRPNIRGKCGHHGWLAKHKVVQQGEGWLLAETSFGYGNNSGGKPAAIVDGIEYPINPDNIEDMDKEVANILRHNIFLIFKTGEVEVAANREQLDYVRKTQSVIRLKCKEIVDYMKKNLSNQIAKAPTYWAAKSLWKKVVDSTNLKHIISKVEWTAEDGKKIKINGNRHSFNSDVDVDGHVVYKDNGVIRRKQRYMSGVEFDEASPIIINDAEKTPSPARMTTVWANYTDQTRFQCITITRAEMDDEEYEKTIQKFLTDSLIKYMPHTRLSTVERQKVVRAKGDGTKKPSVKYNVYNIPDASQHRTYPKCEVDLSEAEGYYVWFEQSQMMVGKGRSNVGQAYEQFEVAFNLLNIDPTKEDQKVYAIPVRWKDKVPEDCKLKDLNKAINDKIDEMMKTSNVNMIDLAFMDEHSHEWNDPWDLIKLRLDAHADKFDDQGNMLLKLYQTIDDTKKLIGGIRAWITAQQQIGQGIDYGNYRYDRWDKNKAKVVPSLWTDIEAMVKEIEIHMPLISNISYNRHRRGETNDITNRLIDYANLCQERHNKTKKQMSVAI